MRIGHCPACDAHTSEIAFLRERVKVLEDKLVNIADPLVDARLAAAQSAAQPPTPPRVRVPWYVRKDAPPVEPEAPPKSNREIHESFQREEPA